MCIFLGTNFLIKKLKIKDFKKKNLLVIIFGLIIYGLLYWLLIKLVNKEKIKNSRLKQILLALLILDIIPITIFLYKNEVKGGKNRSTIVETKPTVNQPVFNKKPDLRETEKIDQIGSGNEQCNENKVNEPFNNPTTPPLQITNYVTTSGTKNIDNALGDAFNTRGKSNDIDSDNVLSIDEVLRVDKVLEETNYASTRSKKRKNQPKLTETDFLEKLKTVDEIPDYLDFTTTSNVSSINFDKN